jgi:hypothetical protein
MSLDYFSGVTLAELAHDAYPVRIETRSSSSSTIPPVRPPTHASPPLSTPEYLRVCDSIRQCLDVCNILVHDLARPVHALIVRNHGHSPATAPHTFHAMATDLLAFFATHDLSRGRFFGHSMGIKAPTAAARPGKAVGGEYHPAAGAMARAT